jgi:hypothetical protein
MGFASYTNGTAPNRADLSTPWVGAIRDHVGGNLIYAGNSGNDPDANEIITNVIGQNLICFGNKPAAQYGDAMFVPGAAPNVVGGHALGECAPLTEPFPT